MEWMMNDHKKILIYSLFLLVLAFSVSASNVKVLDEWHYSGDMFVVEGSQFGLSVGSTGGTTGSYSYLSLSLL